MYQKSYWDYFVFFRWVDVLKYVVQAELPDSGATLREGSGSSTPSVRQPSFVPPPTPTTPNNPEAMIYEDIEDEEEPAEETNEADA